MALAHSTSFPLRDSSHSIAEMRSAIDLYCLCAGVTQSRLSGAIACAGRYRAHVRNLHYY